MIDLHCHLLPGIDDGARDLDETLQLIRQAQAQGIRRIVTTPHWMPGRFDNDASKVLTELAALQQALKEHNIVLPIRAAQEVRISDALLDALPQQRLLFLGQYRGQNVLLLEFPHSHLTPGYEVLIRWLLKQGILPMIAHPERNRELLEHPGRIKVLQQFGCLFQLTASSLLGDMGSDSQLLAERYLQDGIFDIIATDTHSLKRRPPRLAEARDRAAELLGSAHAQQLVFDTPQHISDALFRDAS